ncbi:MAG: hypothetical protein ACC707_14065 [Thiohalomonadales bacterium]
MYEMMVETLLIAFVLGGIMGAITALHLAAPKRVRVETKSADRNRPR